jgi:hypothetical protein
VNKTQPVDYDSLKGTSIYQQGYVKVCCKSLQALPNLTKTEKQKNARLFWRLKIRVVIHGFIKQVVFAITVILPIPVA